MNMDFLGALKQIEQNAKASGRVLPPETLAQIDALFPA